MEYDIVQVVVGGDGSEIFWRQGDKLARKAVTLVQVRDDTCLKDAWSMEMEQSVYSSRGTEIIGLGHCLGIGNEGEKGVKCNLIFQPLS